MYQMPASRFAALVPHLHHYGGAVAAANRTEEGEAPPMVPPPMYSTIPAARPGSRVIGATAAELRMSDIGDLISIGQSDG